MPSNSNGGRGGKKKDSALMDNVSCLQCPAHDCVKTARLDDCVVVIEDCVVEKKTMLLEIRSIAAVLARCRP